MVQWIQDYFLAIPLVAFLVLGIYSEVNKNGWSGVFEATGMLVWVVGGVILLGWLTRG